MSTYWRKRLVRHLRLAVGSAVLVGIVFQLTPPPDTRHRISVASAYVALILLGWTLLLGPWNLFRSRPNPVSFDLRRDLGIWAGILALFHTAVGLTVHLRGRMWMYFFSKLHPLTFQKTRFGFANGTGLGATLFFLFLLLISNDRSIRSLGIRWWKLLQRGTYLTLGLTFVHGWAYQSLEKRTIPWIAVFWFMGAIIAALQLAGIRQWKASNRQRLPAREQS